MKLKVLVTGRNTKISTDVTEHLSDEKHYITTQCDPTQTGLFKMMLGDMPDVIIICLRNESKESIQAYNVLKNASKEKACTIIVVADEEDEQLFMQHTELQRMYFLSRPISLMALYQKLESIEEEMEETKRKNLALFREFENEAPDKNRRKSVLVVDDDTEQLIVIKDNLEEFYDVTPVKSGKAAFKYLTKHIPDIILLDYLMPGEDGPTVLRNIRMFDEYADIPVIFLTGMSEKQTVIQTIKELKPQGYIVKPSKKSEIVAKIIDVLG